MLGLRRPPGRAEGSGASRGGRDRIARRITRGTLRVGILEAGLADAHDAGS